MAIQLPSLESFDDIYKKVVSRRKQFRYPSILLGNGFSISFGAHYQAANLLELGDFRNIHANPAIRLFKIYNTLHYEEVMNRLSQIHQALALYSKCPPALRELITEDVTGFQTAFINAINHWNPEGLDKFPANQRECCAHFLSSFNYIYTLNYDVLLPLVIMEDAGGSERSKFFFEGFSKRRAGKNRGRWHWSGRAPRQNVVYLHGSFVLFLEAKRLWYLRPLPAKRISIGSEIEHRIRNRIFPEVVTAGNSEDKVLGIRQSPYLWDAYSHFSHLSGVLFVHGCSLGETDKHIKQAIVRSNVKDLCYGVFIEDGNQTPSAVMHRIQELAEERQHLIDEGQDLPNLNCHFFDIRTATPWTYSFENHNHVQRRAPGVFNKAGIPGATASEQEQLS